MRILLASDFYAPLVGGVEQHVRMLGRELVARGHRVAVATVRPAGDLPTEEDDGGVAVHRLRSTLARIPRAHVEGERPFAAPAPDPEVTFALAALVRRFRPDVVHAHGWIGSSYLPIAMGTRAAFVVTAHEYGLVCARKDLLYLGTETCSGPGLAKCLRCAGDHYGPVRGTALTLGTFASGAVERRLVDGLLAVSKAVVRGNGLDDARATVVPNFLPDEDPPETSAVGAFVRDLPSGRFILFVGALGGHKGLPELFRAYEALPDGRPPLVLIGHRWVDTPDRMPDGVVIFEDVPNDAVRAAWRRATIGVIPSTWPEPFGIVALEAMAAGVPVVASRTGGLADIIGDNETGLLVEPRDECALSAAVVRLLTDDPLRDRLGRAARSAVEDYRASAVIPRIESAYVAAIAARRRSSGFGEPRLSRSAAAGADVGEPEA